MKVFKYKAVLFGIVSALLSIQALGADLVQNLSQYPTDQVDSHYGRPRVTGMIEIPIRAVCDGGMLYVSYVQSDKSGYAKMREGLAVDPSTELYILKVDSNKLLNGWVGIAAGCGASYFSTTLRVYGSSQLGGDPFSLVKASP